MKERERKKQVNLPSCAKPNWRESHVVRNGSHRGRPRYCCRNCKCRLRMGCVASDSGLQRWLWGWLIISGRSKNC